MEPKQKAIELYNKCLLYISKSDPIAAKACATICADEILSQLNNDNIVWDNNTDEDEPTIDEYWEQVKEEISKI